MSSKSDKVKIENIRIKMQHDFENKYKDIIEKANQTDRLKNENDLLNNKVSTLINEVQKYKEWNERIIEYLDLDKAQLEAIKKDLSLAKTFDDTMKIFKSISGRCGLLF